MRKPLNNFTTIDTVYGKWVTSRHCQYHAEYFVKTGDVHIPDEVKIILSIINTLPNDCVVVDAGSNIGAVSVPVATDIQSRGGRVYAFEVQKQLFRALCGTAVLNDLENLDVFNLGLGSKHDTLKIQRVDYSKPWDYGLVSLVDQAAIAQAEYDTVDIFPLDDFELPRLDFLKIDVEGMEMAVLEGGDKTIRAGRPWAYVEYWNSDHAALKKWFTDQDYSVYSLPGGNILCCPNEKLAESKLDIKFPLF